MPLPPERREVLAEIGVAAFALVLTLTVCVWALYRGAAEVPSPPAAITPVQHPRCFPEWTEVTRPHPLTGEPRPMFEGCPDDRMNQQRSA